MAIAADLLQRYTKLNFYLFPGVIGIGESHDFFKSTAALLKAAGVPSG